MEDHEGVIRSELRDEGLDVGREREYQGCNPADMLSRTRAIQIKRCTMSSVSWTPVVNESCVVLAVSAPQ